MEDQTLGGDDGGHGGPDQEGFNQLYVKEAIFAKYEINEEMYRQWFQEPDILPRETPQELYHRLKDLYKKWVKPARKTVEEEVLILEQFLRTLSPENGQKAAQLVMFYLINLLFDICLFSLWVHSIFLRFCL
uniref:SCAN box domain-containing protein n=1 Tax=Sander lucioperca TaxID=283035 RepID=A0A8C9ZVN0_SANLU